MTPDRREAAVPFTAGSRYNKRELREARKIATREHTTLRALVEQGLRKIIAERKTGRPFELRVITFKGEGLVPELRDAGWERIRDLAYEGRGG